MGILGGLQMKLAKTLMASAVIATGLGGVALCGHSV
jgi:hypothetical protein